MLIVPLCQSKNKGHLSTGMPRSQVTGSSRAERRTWPLGRREVAGAIWGSLKSLTSRSHRIGLEPTASSPVSNLKSFQSTSKHTVCTRKTFNDKFTNTEYCFKNAKIWILNFKIITAGNSKILESIWMSRKWKWLLVVNVVIFEVIFLRSNNWKLMCLHRSSDWCETKLSWLNCQGRVVFFKLN